MHMSLRTELRRLEPNALAASESWCPLHLRLLVNGGLGRRGPLLLLVKIRLELRSGGGSID